MSMYIHIYVYIHLINYPQQDNLETFKVFLQLSRMVKPQWDDHIVFSLHHFPIGILW